jgi:hypothetical protein
MHQVKVNVLFPVWEDTFIKLIVCDKSVTNGIVDTAIGPSHIRAATCAPPNRRTVAGKSVELLA